MKKPNWDGFSWFEKVYVYMRSAKAWVRCQRMRFQPQDEREAFALAEYTRLLAQARALPPCAEGDEVIEDLERRITWLTLRKKFRPPLDK